MSERYKDFEKTNRIWGFTEMSPPRFEEIDLDLMIAGDTDSVYLKIPESLTVDRSPDDIVGTCDEIARAIDKTFPEFVQSVFNCPDERKDTIKTDREAVSDKSLFLTKKRYIMRIVDMEGSKPPPGKDLKIMGVEIKKSDSSVAVKTMLMELVNAILDGNSMSDVLAMIAKMKRDFKTRFSIEEIGTPVSCNTLKKAEDIFRTTGSMKGIAWQARSAMFYNKVRTNVDRPCYPGDKILSVYIKHPESKYIGFPADLDRLPDWANEIVFDYDAEWQKANKKLTNYLKAIGWDLESRKEKQKTELFGF